MIEHSKGSSNRQSAHHTVVARIHEIYANHDQSAAHEITKLLVNVLRRSNYRSRLALIRFFDVSRMSQTKSAPQLDLVLIASARLLINGLNAHRVQDWISGYEGSSARSERRSLYERILRDFVASRTAVEAMKSQVRATRTLATDVRSKCDALKRLIKSMPGNADVPANAAMADPSAVITTNNSPTNQPFQRSADGSVPPDNKIMGAPSAGKEQEVPGRWPA